MSNAQLLIIGVIVVGLAIWWSVTRTSAASAPTLLAVIMLVLAMGGPIWEWSKYSGSAAALPPVVKAADFGQSNAVQAFLWAAIGAGLSALLIPKASQWVESKHWVPPKKISIATIIAAMIAFVGLLIGQGSSFFRREVYLDTDGVDFLLNVSWPVGTLLALVAVVMIANEDDRRIKLYLIAVAVLWFVAPAATGSRTACAIPMVGVILIVRNEIRKKRIHPGLISLAIALFSVTVVTFSAVNRARDMPHGLLNLPNVVSATVSDMLISTDSFLLPVKQLLASVFVAFPDAEQSVIYNVDLSVLVANANPLPGTAQPWELERYWPYEWVPLSFVGTWFGATGWIGQVLLYAGIGWVLGYTMHNLQRGRFQLAAFLPLAITALIGMLSIQYSSRMVWRMVSMAVLLLMASYLVRDSSHLRDPRALEPGQGTGRRNTSVEGSDNYGKKNEPHTLPV